MDWAAAITISVIIDLMVFVAVGAGVEKGEEGLKKQLIEKGYAEYIVDKEGHTSFHIK